MASPGWGGLEKVFADLVNRLATRCEVMVMTPEGADVLSHLSDAVVEVVSLPRGSRRNPITIRRLADRIRRLRPDLVHSHAAKAAEMVHRAVRRTELPHLATKHNTRKRRIFHRVPAVAAVSEAVARTVVNPRAVSVVYNGLEPRAVPARELPDVFTVLAVGRLHPAKGFDLLVRQAAQLDFLFRLRIAGEGPAREDLRALVRELALEERVELLGHRTDVPELLARSHVQVVSSRTEGFSLALLEGLFYANALVSTPVGIAPEILPPEMIVDADALASALTGVHDRWDEAVARLAALREELAPRFHIDHTVERYLSIYGEMLEGA